MPRWLYYVIGPAAGLTIWLSALFFPTLLFVYYFLILLFLVAVIEWHITRFVYRIIKSTQRR